jgi:very-short-patch-repair endonuclease
LAVEYDGGNHRERMVEDNRRQNVLLNNGYQVLRFTAADVYTRPKVVVADVRAALAGRQTTLGTIAQEGA